LSLGDGRKPGHCEAAAKLKEARASLEKIRNQFAAKSVLTAGHGDTRRAADDAIREIDSALTVR
jgi:hypothetical protein